MTFLFKQSPSKSHLVLLLFCVMVHSGVAFATERHVYDLFDSTAFNVAMFAMGWAATRLRMKGNDSPLGWLALAPLALLPPIEKLRRSPSTSAVKADAGGDVCAAQEVVVADVSPKTALLSTENEVSEPLLSGLCSLLTNRVASSPTEMSLKPWNRSPFHSKEAQDMDYFGDYLSHIHWFFECSSPCLVLALIYLDRALEQSGGAKLVLSSETCHRLFLTSLLAAVKFHDDDYVPYSNTFYAETASVDVKDLNAMEKQFCKLIDWRFDVGPEEYIRYYDLITDAACATSVA